MRYLVYFMAYIIASISLFNGLVIEGLLWIIWAEILDIKAEI